MSLFLLAFAEIFMIAPLLTQNIYRELLEKQQRQIKIDNQAILIGRKQREIFNDLRISNEKIMRREGQHHLFHACAYSTLPERELCQIQDKAIERELIREHQMSGIKAEVEWARLSGSEFKIQGLSENIPIREIRCEICGLALLWEVEGELPVYSITLEETGQSVHWGLVGKSLLKPVPWNYYLDYD